MKKSCIFCVFFWIISVCSVLAQKPNIKIELSNNSLTIGKLFTITVIIQNSEQRDARGFPNIQGFQKRELETVTTSTVLKGKSVLNHRITQNYLAEQEGTFRLAQFSMLVNGVPVRSEGTIITVDAAINEASDDLGILESESNNLDFDAKENAFLALKVNTSKVVVGQGFTVKLALYVAETNTIEMNFPDNLSTQVANIARKLQPANCLIENFGIEEIQTLPLLINGKKFTEYKLYQAVLYPLNAQEVRFPVVSLDMLVGKAVKRFESKSFPVKVSELPSHPQRNHALVGMFQLRDRVSVPRVVTGRSFQYEVVIQGEGNLTAINAPRIDPDTLFDFYPPTVRQSVSRRLGRVTGEKVFSFQVIPKQAGSFVLDKYIKWLVFNPSTAQYDTLKSTLRLNVSGRSLKDDTGDANDESVYAGIEKADSTQQEIDYRTLIKGIANLLLAMMLLGMIAVFWTRRPEK